MDCFLLVDFGSTFTKLTLVDINNETIIKTAKAKTSIEDDIMIGFNEAYQALVPIINDLNIKIVDKLGCSSAAGGLKMIAIGLVPELTSEASKRAALGAGAKILKSYSYELTASDVLEIVALKPEIILFSGGTDGGNQNVVLANAKMLANYEIKAPIIIACNKSIQDEVAQTFLEANFEYHQCANVMPKINVLNVDEVREVIREVFMNNIVKAKGLDKALDYIGDILMPTPAAVLKGASLLATGTDLEDGIGDLVIIDIGGATTDIHSICLGYPTKGGVSMKGLEEPFEKRSVEGDLGMRYSLDATYHVGGYRLLNSYLKEPLDYQAIEHAITSRMNDVKQVACSSLEQDFDNGIAKICANLAMARHAGYIEQSYSPFGIMFAQFGKDLTGVKYLIGTGGILNYGSDPKAILKSACFDENNVNVLKPINPRFLLDKTYIFSAMGLLASKHPDIALRIMKKYMIEI